ncbi:hypothetical protein [Streptomyces sp. NPDC052107]|uniref:hypothetical protein n=1 Tax=Streptomyces sp. NPDC052107 TaxID=3155632 RepID=UPI00341D1D78
MRHSASASAVSASSAGGDGAAVAGGECRLRCGSQGSGSGPGRARCSGGFLQVAGVASKLPVEAGRQRLRLADEVVQRHGVSGTVGLG